MVKYLEKSLILVGKMRVFCFTSNDNCHFFLRKTGETPKWVVDLLLEKDTFRKKKKHGNKSSRISSKKLHQPLQTLDIVRILSVKPKT